MIIKTKDGINIKELDFIYYIDIQTYEIIKIDLNLEKSKSINYEFHEIGKYLSYSTIVRECTKYLLQFLNNTLKKHNNLNVERYICYFGTKSVNEIIKHASSFFYGDLKNVEKEKISMTNKYFEEHVKVKDLLDYLNKFEKEDLIHFCNEDSEYGNSFKTILIKNISQEIVISKNLIE